MTHLDRTFRLTRVQTIDLGEAQAKVMATLTLKVSPEWEPSAAVLELVDRDGDAVLNLVPLPMQHEILAHQVTGIAPATPDTETVVFDITPEAHAGEVKGMGPGLQRALAYGAGRATKDQLLGGTDLSGFSASPLGAKPH